MLFNSWQFAIFFPVVFALYWALPEKFRVYLILVSSYYFYMSWNAKYIVLILFTTIISYLAAILLERFRNARKFILVITLLSCLGVLFVFKYYNFLIENLVSFLNLFAIKLHPATLKLLLPVGISFYTFQTLSYVIDVYRGNLESEKNFAAYAAFVSFFPQLVAGPIERTKNLLPQIKNPHVFKYEQGVYGLKLMLWGFFKKIVVADYIAIWINGIFENLRLYQGFVLIITVFFFSIQVYCDFSGYSDIARGCAKLMGIELMVNFKSPYFSSSIKEFWSRWHISLSTWFRDYMYFPLGGSRVSRLKHYRNIMIVFITSGLWHGANWTYIIWGGVCGLAQVIESFFALNRRRNFVSVLCVFTFSCAISAFFRSQNMSDVIYIFSHMFDGITSLGAYIYTGVQNISAVSPDNDLILAVVLIIILEVCDYLAFNYDDVAAMLDSKISGKNIFLRWAIYVLITDLFIIAVTLTQGAQAEFIYFQF